MPLFQILALVDDVNGNASTYHGGNPEYFSVYLREPDDLWHWHADTPTALQAYNLKEALRHAAIRVLDHASRSHAKNPSLSFYEVITALAPEYTTDALAVATTALCRVLDPNRNFVDAQRKPFEPLEVRPTHPLPTYTDARTLVQTALTTQV